MSDNNSSNIDTSTEGLLSHSLVLFGALGDLSLRKLMPALYQLEHAQLLSDDLKIMAVARSAFNNDELKARIKDTLNQYLGEAEVRCGIERGAATPVLLVDVDPGVC